MNRRKSVSRLVAMACALSIAVTPLGHASVLQAPEAEVFGATRFEALPPELQPGLRLLVSRLVTVDADPDTIDAAEAFLAFADAHPDLFEKPVSELTRSELEIYAAELARAAAVLDALSPISRMLAEEGWLREAHPDIAEKILGSCGRRYLDGRDMFEAVAKILRDDDTFVGEPQNLLDDLSGSARECIENLLEHTRVAADTINRLEQGIADRQRELEDARSRGDMEAVERLEAEIEEKREQINEIKQSRDLAALLAMLAGLARAAAGVAGVVATGGACTVCYVEIAQGAAAIVVGWNRSRQESTTITETVPARFPGIDPHATPSDEERQQQIDQVETDPDYDYIESSRPGGNFLIARDRNSGHLVIFQITPILKITVDFSNERIAVASPVTDDAVASIEDLAAIDADRAVRWTRVVDPFDVQTTHISLTLEGERNGTLLTVSLERNPVDAPFLITVEAR